MAETTNPDQFPSTAEYTDARGKFKLKVDPPPPADPLPLGPEHCPPASVLPKIQLPFYSPMGVAPRGIYVERLKRLYLSMDIEKLLAERNVNFALEAGFLATEVQFPPIFELWDFDDDKFDPRTVEEWLGIGMNESGEMIGIPVRMYTHPENAWMLGIVTAYSEQKKRWLVRAVEKKGGEPEWLPRLQFFFLAEDPRVFADRVANAVNERRRVESWIRFDFYVESMPMKSLPELPEAVVEKIKAGVPSPRRAVTRDVLPYMGEITISYKTTFNRPEFGARVKGDQMEAQSLGLVNLSVPPPPKSMQAPASPSFLQMREDFAFHSLYTKDCILGALHKTRASCLEVQNTVMLVLSSKKSYHLEEFQQIQAAQVTKAKRYVTEDWVPQLGRDLRSSLAGVNKGWFNLEERDREVYAMSKFSNFMTLVSSMMIDSARKCVQQNFELFDGFVQGLAPHGAEIISATDVVCKFDKDSDGALIQPLFEIDMAVEGDEVGWATEPVAFRNAVNALLTSVVDSVRSVPVIEPRVLPDLFKNVTLTLSVINENEENLVRHRESVLKVLDGGIALLGEYLATFEKYREFIHLEHAKVVEQLNQDQPGLDVCRAEIRQHQEAMEEIYESVPKRAFVGLFAVNVTSVRNFLIGKRRLMVKAVLDYVAKNAKNNFKKLLGEYKNIEARITAIPTKIEELDQTRQYITTVPGLTEKLHARVCESMRLYDFLDEYGHGLAQEDFNNKWLLYGRARHCQGLIDKARQTLEQFFQKFEQELEMNQEKFTADLDKLSMEVTAVSKMTDVSSAETNATDVRRVAKALEAAEQTARLYNTREVMFGREVTDYGRVAELKKTFDPYFVLWPNVDNWARMRQSIQEKPMVQLNADQIAKDLQGIFTALHKSVKTFKGGPASVLQIATDMKNEVVEMRDHLPLLTALLNPGMKQRHWVKLSEALGFEFQLDEEITVKDALTAGLEEKMQ